MSDSIPCLRLEGVQSEGYYSTHYIASRMMQVRNGLEGDFDPTGIIGTIYARQQMRTTFQAPMPLDQSRGISADPDVFSNDVSESPSPHGVDSQMVASTQEAAAGVFYCDDCEKTYKGKSAYTSYLRHRRTDHSNLMYQCPHCGERNRRTDNLAVHIRTQHPRAAVPRGRDEWIAHQIPAISSFS